MAEKLSACTILTADVVLGAPINKLASLITKQRSLKPGTLPIGACTATNAEERDAPIRSSWPAGRNQNFPVDVGVPAPGVVECVEEPAKAAVSIPSGMKGVTSLTPAVDYQGMFLMEMVSCIEAPLPSSIQQVRERSGI